MTATVEELVVRARALAAAGERRILGITGAPGAGKTTVTRQIVDALGPELAAFVPMDGFHLSNATLIAWNRRDRKGAWDTFDAEGYVRLLDRLRSQNDEIVHAPDFDRDVEQSIGSAIPVSPQTPLIVTEGNYLLSQHGAWNRVAALLDECWYLDIDDATRLQRLTRRHVLHGKSHEDAEAWASGTDQANANLIAQGKDRATAVFTLA